MKIYDCSNSYQRPSNRGFGGPVENAVVTLLKKHAEKFDATFVDNPQSADIIFTNDVFPNELHSLNKKYVKRMDGIFWQNDLKERNVLLNQSALFADHVVFVSEYSQKSLWSLCKILLPSTVVLNTIDEATFRPSEYKKPKFPITWIAASTSWDRKEKRFDDLIRFSSLLKKDNGCLFLVGNLSQDIKLPDNVFNLGYITDPEIWASCCQTSDAMVNLSYRDASPKVVSEGAACGLPVLYADSGGVRELLDGGVGIKDKDDLVFEDATPPLNFKDIEEGYEKFKSQYANLKKSIKLATSTQQLLQGYFSVFKKVLS